MLASLHYLLGDAAAARAAIELALAGDAYSPSDTNLKRLIEAELTADAASNTEHDRRTELGPPPSDSERPAAQY